MIGAREADRPVLVAQLAFGALLVIAAALYLYFTRSTAPSFDEWVWAVQRRGGSASTFLSTYNGHLSLVPVAIYKLLWATFGLASYVPYRVMVTAFVLACAALIYVYARRRVGDVGGLVASALILFYGPGWQDILWPFQIGWLGSIAGGLIALIALDHRSRRADIVACAGVALTLACSSVGAAIAAGLTVDVLARPDRRRRAWIVLGPLLLYAIWWLTDQHSAVTSGSLSHTPGFVARMLAASLSGLIGLWHAAPADQTAPVGWRLALVVIAVAVLVGRLVVRFSLRAAVLALIALLFAIAAGANRAAVSPGVDSRYLLVVAVFAVLCAVELAADHHWSSAATAAVIVLAAIVCGSNLGLMRKGGAHLRADAVYARADLAALALVRQPIPPSHIARYFPGYPLVILPGRGLMTAVHDLRFAIASPAQLRGYPEAARKTVDGELSDLEDVRPQTAPPPTGAPARGCVRVVGEQSPHEAAQGMRSRAFTIPPPGLLVTNQGTVTVVAARRFAAAFTNTGLVGGHQPALVRATPDGVAVPWQVRVSPTGAATVCPA